MERLVIDTPETREALERWQQGKINIGDELARMETERNALRERNRELESALAYSAEGQTLLSKFLQAVKDRDEAQTKIKRQTERIRYLEGATNHASGTPLFMAIRERDEARALAILLAEAIVSTLEDNRHLADGENCTLSKLKSAVPHWK